MYNYYIKKSEGNRMFGTYFGKYLLDEGVLTEDQYGNIMSEVRQCRMKIGQLANAEGYMTDTQADEINHLQLNHDVKFGELAVEKGYLEEKQVSELLEKQEETYLIFVKILIGEYNFSPEELQKYVNNFKKNENYTAGEIDTLKSNDIDKVMEIFTKNDEIPELVKDYIDIIGKNLIRFTENDVRFEAVEIVRQYASGSMIYQDINGDSHISVGICSGNDGKGMYRLGKIFTDNLELKCKDDDIINTVSDFLNLTNALFIKKENELNMRKEKIKIFSDMISLSSEKDIYVMPFYIAGDRMDVIISMDSELNIA